MWISLLLPLLALADFNGRWVGTGTLSSNKQWNGECHRLDAKIEQTRHRFRLLNFSYACIDIGFSGDYLYDFRITPEGKLKDAKGNVMGVISDDHLRIDFLDKDGQPNFWQLDRKEDGSLEHSDSYYWGEETFIRTKGVLRKQP